MTFAKSDLMKTAKLARLCLSEDEIDRFGAELNSIVSFVAQLNEVNVDGVQPMSHAGERSLFLRDDVVAATLGLDCFKSSAGFEDGLIKVPKIIE